MDISASQYLKKLTRDRQDAEVEAANKHGLDLTSFSTLLDERVYFDSQVLRIQSLIDSIIIYEKKQ